MQRLPIGPGRRKKFLSTLRDSQRRASKFSAAFCGGAGIGMDCQADFTKEEFARRRSFIKSAMGEQPLGNVPVAAHGAPCSLRSADSLRGGVLQRKYSNSEYSCNSSEVLHAQEKRYSLGKIQRKATHPAHTSGAYTGPQNRLCPSNFY